MSSVSTNISGTDNDFDRPSGTGSFCIATQALRTWLLMLSLRDKIHLPADQFHYACIIFNVRYVCRWLTER
jgi:hypothetical protein